MDPKREKDLVKITSAGLNAGEILAKVASNAAGANSAFVGTTRDTFEGKKVARLEYEAYVPMAEKELQKLCERVRERWDVEKIAIFHRTGVVPLGEASVVIAISSAHRKESLEAVHFAIDDLKATVPIWKKEVYTDGSNSWKENKECPWSANGGRDKEEADEEEEEEEVEIDSALVQITASRSEMDRRIEAFIERKRAELNNSNVLEFCNRHISEDPEFSCARVDSVLVGRRDGKSHFRQSQVVNHDGPQTKSKLTPPKRVKTEERPSAATAAEEDSEVPVGIRERLLELEKKVPAIAPKGPVPKDVYARIKALEDRVRYLEGISPEYFCNFVKMESESDNGSASGSSGAGDRGEDLAKSLSGINTRIQQLQASLMVKKRETE